MGSGSSVAGSNSIKYDPAVLGSSRSTKMDTRADLGEVKHSEQFAHRNRRKAEIAGNAERSLLDPEQLDLQNLKKSELVEVVSSLRLELQRQNARAEDAVGQCRSLQSRVEEVRAELEGVRREFKAFRVSEIQQRTKDIQERDDRIEDLTREIAALKAEKRQWLWEMETRGGMIHNGGCGLVL